MEQLINEILEIEKQAQQITAQARNERAHFEEKLALDAENLKRELNERMEKKLLAVKELEEKFSKEQVEKINESFQNSKKRLEDIKEENFDKYVSSIVDNVLKG